MQEKYYLFTKELFKNRSDLALPLIDDKIRRTYNEDAVWEAPRCAACFHASILIDCNQLRRIF